MSENGASNVRSIKPSPQRKLRVLVVDDDLDAVHMMALLVQQMGHEADFAINGFAALDVARRFRPDVILLDIGLPDFKGQTIARQLKWEPGLEATRIYAVTGRTDQQTREDALEAGCERLFLKPLAPQDLEELLANS